MWTVRATAICLTCANKAFMLSTNKHTIKQRHAFYRESEFFILFGIEPAGRKAFGRIWEMRGKQVIGASLCKFKRDADIEAGVFCHYLTLDVRQSDDCFLLVIYFRSRQWAFNLNTIYKNIHKYTFGEFQVVTWYKLRSRVPTNQR